MSRSLDGHRRSPENPRLQPWGGKGGYPPAQAVAALSAEWHRCRFLWNEAVHQFKTGRRPTFATLAKLLTEARGQRPWLREGSQVAQQQMLRT